MFVIFSEHLNTNENWYYGSYSNENRANEIAIELTHTGTAIENNIYYNVIEASEAKDYNILNLPESLR